MHELSKTFGMGVDRDLSTFGNVLWRGLPLEVCEQEPITINPETSTGVSFLLNAADMSNFRGGALSKVIPQVGLHIRTRFAHLGLDIDGSFDEALKRAKDKSNNGDIATINMLMVNFGQRPIKIAKGARIFHPFFVPDKAYITGKNLEDIVGNKKGKPVYIEGEEGEDWRMIYEYNSEGKEEASGILLRIDRNERFRIPPSLKPIEISENGTFVNFRKWFDANAERVNPQLSLDNIFWIGKGPHINLSPTTYIKLGLDTYEEVNGEFIRVGSQVSSPLLEGLRTNHRPHLEIKGKAEWIGASVVRNGHLATAG